MKWITRARPKIDRIACPWLIRKFVDPDAEFIYVPFEEVLEQSKLLNAIPFDIPGVEYTHYNDECTFDYIIRKHRLDDGALAMPGDQAAFVDAACWLLEEVETLRRVRLNARQHASRQGWPAIVEQFEGYLDSACRNVSAAAGRSTQYVQRL